MQEEKEEEVTIVINGKGASGIRVGDRARLDKTLMESDDSDSDANDDSDESEDEEELDIEEDDERKAGHIMRNLTYFIALLALSAAIVGFVFGVDTRIEGAKVSFFGLWLFIAIVGAGLSPIGYQILLYILRNGFRFRSDLIFFLKKLEPRANRATTCIIWSFSWVGLVVVNSNTDGTGPVALVARLFAAMLTTTVVIFAVSFAVNIYTFNFFMASFSVRMRNNIKYQKYFKTIDDYCKFMNGELPPEPVSEQPALMKNSSMLGGLHKMGSQFQGAVKGDTAEFEVFFEKDEGVKKYSSSATLRKDAIAQSDKLFNTLHQYANMEVGGGKSMSSISTTKNGTRVLRPCHIIGAFQWRGDPDAVKSSIKAYRIFRLGKDERKGSYIFEHEMRRSIFNFLNEQQDLKATLADSKSLVSSLEALALTFAGFPIAISWLVVFNVNVASLLATLATLMIFIALMFGGFINDVFTAFGFLLASHPYDVGDTVEIEETIYKVVSIKLLTTTFRRLDGTEVIIANSELATTPIGNLRRSGCQSHILEITVPGSTSVSTLEELREKVEEFVESQMALDLFPEVEFSYHEVTLAEEVLVITINITMVQRTNFQDESIRKHVRSQIVRHIIERMGELGLCEEEEEEDSKPNGGDAASQASQRPGGPTTQTSSMAGIRRRAAPLMAKRFFHIAPQFQPRKPRKMSMQAKRAKKD